MASMRSVGRGNGLRKISGEGPFDLCIEGNGLHEIKGKG